MFAGGYIWRDLKSAGLDTDFADALRDGGHRPVETWWPRIKPYWDYVKHTSFTRALLITIRDLYGIEEVNDSTIHSLAERVIADNEPGLYQRILYDRCRIQKIITCITYVGYPDDPRILGLSIRLGEALRSPLNSDSPESLSMISNQQIRTLEDAVEALQGVMREDLAKGAVGFKIAVSDHISPDREAAESAFQEALRKGTPVNEHPPLRDFLFDKGLDVAAEAGVPVAVHTGYLDDFRQLDPKLLLGFAFERPDIHFDLFHLGVPMIRDAILIGKNLPNVSLNLTWCAIISQVQTVRALDEILDLVPTNKVIAFGADYKVAVQKVWGHLVMARECVALALTNRINAGLMNRDEALMITKEWFLDNPIKIYRL